AVFESLPEIVNHLKEKLPIFGKEWFEDQTYQWKKNS
ncbi:MAG: molybdenum cofactor biosynthesis protein MoaE, partial [Flavobacteriia bacterium]|nr:molybdenum cofactor biosynthesis protein MoaE [Flavobacteriia bacterium]